MVDVDHFKKFNDTYGHDAGDQVLRKVGRHLAAAPGGGRAFRYGGEEFTVVFAGLGKKEAEPYLEALRARIEEAGFSLRGVKRPKKKPKERRASPRGGKSVHVTVSIGLAECGEKFTTAAEVIAAADQALYRAKQAGRNQVQSA
jgi:diguanylate cyclase (GGDEF)-like protein